MSSTTTDTDDADGDAQIPDHFTEDGRAIPRDMLVAIEQLDEPIGTDVKGHLHTVGYDSITHGRLYTNLDQLADSGLIEKQVHSVDNRANTYVLTDDGRSALAEYRTWLTGGDA